MRVSKIGKSLSKLYVQVLIGIVAGVLVGHFYPDIGSQLKPLGDLFIKLIRMLLAPIIFASVVVGIARMNDLHEAGRVGVKAVLYFEVASTIALLIGLVDREHCPARQWDEHRSHAHRQFGYRHLYPRSAAAWAARILHEHRAQQHCRGLCEWRNSPHHLLLASARDSARQTGSPHSAIRRHARHVPAGHVRRGSNRHVCRTDRCLWRYGLHRRPVWDRDAGVVRGVDGLPLSDVCHLHSRRPWHRDADVRTVPVEVSPLYQG